MTRERQQRGGNLPLQDIGNIIGIFAVVGIGIGLTGAIAITQLGSDSGLLAGILVLVILTIAFILGPVIGVVSGLLTGQRRGRLPDSYLAGIVGSVVGYFFMMLLVFIALSIAISLATGGGGTSSTTSTEMAGSTSSGEGPPIEDYLVPLIAVAIPTAITNVGGIYIGTDSESSPAGSSVDIPWKGVALGVGLLVVITLGVMVAPSLLTPDPQLEISGGASTTQNALYAEGTVSNPTDSEITNTLTIELAINGEVTTTTEDSISVPANDNIQISWRIATVQELTQQEIQAIQNGNFEIRYILNGQTVETYQP